VSAGSSGKIYSLEEQIIFFKGNAISDGSISHPMHELVSALTNDELIHKYLEWIDSHKDENDEITYWGDYPKQCRYEMGRRLKEGIEKSEEHSEFFGPPTNPAEGNIQSDQNHPATKVTFLHKCNVECRKRKLSKGEKMTRKTKYEIGIAIGVELPSFELFKSKNPSYHLISKMLSELGYSRKDPSKLEK
jgi:hypothetical protein